MAFFQNFPKIKVLVQDDPQRQALLTDLFRRITVDRKIIQNSTTFYKYIIQDGERPEHVAHRVYGDAELHWVILLVNNIVDPYYDWPLSTREFELYIRDKYQNKMLRLVPNATYFSYQSDPFATSPSSFTYDSTVDADLLNDEDTSGTATLVYAADLSTSVSETVNVHSVVFVNNVTGSLDGVELTQDSVQLTTGVTPSIHYHGNFQAGDILTQLSSGVSVRVVAYDSDTQHIEVEDIDQTDGSANKVEHLAQPSTTSHEIFVSNRTWDDGTPVLALVQKYLTTGDAYAIINSPSIIDKVDAPRFYLSRRINGKQFILGRETDRPWSSSNPYATTTDTRFQSYDRTRTIHDQHKGGYEVSTDIQESGWISGPVTNLEYEIMLNDAKKSILLLQKEFLTQFQTEFNQRISREGLV